MALSARTRHVTRCCTHHGPRTQWALPVTGSSVMPTCGHTAFGVYFSVVCCMRHELWHAAHKVPLSFQRARYDGNECTAGGMGCCTPLEGLLGCHAAASFGVLHRVACTHKAPGKAMCMQSKRKTSTVATCLRISRYYGGSHLSKRA